MMGKYTLMSNYKKEATLNILLRVIHGLELKMDHTSIIFQPIPLFDLTPV